MTPFIEELIKQGVISNDKVDELLSVATEKFNGNIEEALISGGVSEEAILDVKSMYYGLPKKKVDPKTIGSELFKYIPEDSAEHYHFVPIGMEDSTLLVGMASPDDIQATDALRFIAEKHGIPFKIFLITESSYKTIMQGYRGLSGTVDQALSELDAEIEKANEVTIDDTKNIQERLKPGEEEKIVEEAPIIKIVAVILNNATEGNASDIHIENTGDKVKVRFRVDGQLHTSIILPVNVYAGVIARIKILAKMRLDEKRKPQDGGFSAKIAGRKIDFRVSTLPSYYGEKVVMRILDSEKGVKSLDQLGLSPQYLQMVRDALARPYGLILITGPTGSGKSTTLYSVLNELDRESSNVVSLEDPVEYHIPDVNQSQVMPEIGYTFASGLRSILRQDPDIIMVGEIRDAETAQLAIQAALTGHLVFSTLHTNNAIGVIPRLIDMGIDPYLIAPVLVLSIAQRLARMSCASSVRPTANQSALREMSEKQFADLPAEFKAKLPLTGDFTEAVPSAECPVGTRGRMAIFEMYPTDPDLQALILRKPVDTEIYKLIRAKGFITMRENAILKCIEGKIPFQEIYNL
ncbi:MAG: Flp pilus assembly complex ATPase component TadA [Candidatus Pacebacteria bacterium]|nr:Flp pilus assembly complex ATPase component TadA [Candidatus Paceibacterota bacterium]